MIDGIHASGRHQYWVMQFKGGGSGQLKADMRFETRGGPFSLSNGEFDIELDTLYVNSDKEVFKQGSVSGQLDLKPFVPRDNKSRQVLKYVVLDADINVDVNSLAFINVFTRDFNGMTINGSGQLAGRARLDSGHVLEGTDLAVAADNFLVDVMDHRIQGDGSVSFTSSESSLEKVELSVNYRDLEVTHIGDDSPLLAGKELQLAMHGSSFLLAEQQVKEAQSSLLLSVNDISAPDLALFEHYLPQKWPVDLYGGVGSLQAAAKITPGAVDVDVSVHSKAADLGLRDFRFQSDLDMALKLVNPNVADSSTSIGGSYIKLSNALLAQDDGGDSAEPWEASLVVTAGEFSVIGNSNKQGQENLTDLFQLLGKSEGRKVLGDLEGFIEFESRVSSLAWVAVLMDETYHSAITGRGEVDGVIKMVSGKAAPGTKIDVVSNNLGVGILDYVSNGDGRISLSVDEGDLGPDWMLKIALNGADLMRRGEDTAVVKDVSLEMAALVEDVVREDGGKRVKRDEREKGDRKAALALKIYSANVSDMSIYSSYLPPDSPLQFTRGTASLTADILLLPEDADGWLKLETQDLELNVDGQVIGGDLLADIELVGGIPGEMKFDLSGSKVILDNVRVSGENQAFEGEHWSARFELEQAKTTWEKPLELEAVAEVTISDTRPVVAIFGNKGSKPDWLLQMLTISDIKGRAQVDIAQEQIVIPLAHTVSDIMEIGAKGVISKNSSDGVVYIRYKKLDAVMKVSGDSRNIDLIRAREKYDAYPVAP